MEKLKDAFVLHKVEPNVIDNDIRLFLKHNLVELADHEGGPRDWPKEEDLNTLCQRAGGFFVYAVATAKFLDHKRSNPQERLDLLLKSPESRATKFERDTTLDSLYTAILQEAFNEIDAKDDQKARSVISAVFLASNPLCSSAIATPLDLHVSVVLRFLSPIQSLLILHDDPTLPVRPFHKSFPDFITDPTRCLSERFYVSAPDYHTELLVSCLELMTRGLKKNMCKLPDAVTNSEVDDLQDMVKRYISHALQYARRSWHKHLVGADRMSPHASAIIPTLRRFLEEKFTFYLETLSVLGATKDAIHALGVTKKWLKEVFPVPRPSTRCILTQNKWIHRNLLNSSTIFFGSSLNFSMSSLNLPPTYPVLPSRWHPRPRSFGNFTDKTFITS